MVRKTLGLTVGVVAVLLALVSASSFYMALWNTGARLFGWHTTGLAGGIILCVCVSAVAWAYSEKLGARR